MQEVKRQVTTNKKVKASKNNRTEKPTKADIVALKEHFDKKYGRN